MIIVIGGLARETGKTMFTTNLAVSRAQRKESVAILDCEPDQAAKDWTMIRSRFGEEIGGVTSDTYQIDVHLECGDTIGSLDRLNREYDHVLVDVGPRNLQALQTAIQIADKFYTPLQLSEIYSRMRISDLGEMLLENHNANPKMKSYAFANRSVFLGKAPNKEISQTVDLVSYLSSCNCFKSDWPIMEYDIVKQSRHIGLGINEIPIFGLDAEIRDGQEACDEMAVLANHVFDDEPFRYPKGRFPF